MKEGAPKFEGGDTIGPRADYESFLRTGFMSPREFLNSPDALRLILKYGRPGESIARTILMGKTTAFSGISHEEAKQIESKLQKVQAARGPTKSGGRLLDLIVE